MLEHPTEPGAPAHPQSLSGTTGSPEPFCPQPREWHPALPCPALRGPDPIQSQKPPWASVPLPIHPSPPWACALTNCPNPAAGILPGVVPGDGSHCHLFSVMSLPPGLTSPRLQPYPLLNGFWAPLHQAQTHCRRAQNSWQSRDRPKSQHREPQFPLSPAPRTEPCPALKGSALTKD